MALDPTATAAGVGLVTHTAIDSTNAECLRLARAGERGPLWVAAQIQTAGRGRRGRTWVSEPGNLFASLLMTDAGPPERLSELCFVAGVSVYDAICDAIRAARPDATLDQSGQLALKWPNDVLLDGAKLCGILIEGEGSATVIGIGINCASHPPAAAYPTTDLATAGFRVNPQDMLAALSATMLRRLRQWDRGAGFANIRADWLARAGGLGGRIAVALPGGVRAGLFETLDARGGLVLHLDDGTRETITAGDVLAPRAA